MKYELGPLIHVLIVFRVFSYSSSGVFQTPQAPLISLGLNFVGSTPPLVVTDAPVDCDGVIAIKIKRWG